MEQYDVKCPKCGHENKDLFLEETEGWFICENCQHEHQVPRFKKPKLIPIFSGQQLAAQFKR